MLHFIFYSFRHCPPKLLSKLVVIDVEFVKKNKRSNNSTPSPIPLPRFQCWRWFLFQKASINVAATLKTGEGYRASNNCICYNVSPYITFSTKISSWKNFWQQVLAGSVDVWIAIYSCDFRQGPSFWVHSAPPIWRNNFLLPQGHAPRQLAQGLSLEFSVLESPAGGVHQGSLLV